MDAPNRGILSGVAVIVLTLTVPAAPAAELCTSCTDCEAKLASGLYPTVELANDIIDHAGTCIRLDQAESNLTFDCAGHLIDGDGLAANPVRGIAMLHGSTNTITNCLISDFTSAIYLVETNTMTIVDNHMIGNNIGIDLSYADGNHISGNTVQEAFTGIKLSNSSNNLVEFNTFCDSYPWDIYYASGLDNEGYENVCSVTYYWNDVGASDCTYTCGVFASDFEDGGFGDWIVVTD